MLLGKVFHPRRAPGIDTQGLLGVGGGGASGTIFGNNADYYASAYFACGQFRCSLLAVSWYVRVTLYKFRVLYQ